MIDFLEGEVLFMKNSFFKKRSQRKLNRNSPDGLTKNETCVVFDFPEKPESNQSGVAVENAKEFSDVSDFILNINNLEDLPLGNYKIATTTEKESTESLV
ncbi:hypothetical protein EVAR_75796_1 [Eumeta japonica]|uniref:Uncharacterized protein n=1 Tax=Eumeta variegata TaxID=151549 RepID=A0A4C1TDS4_EUMVA|nr:hypothetical protein EVAR_75796_1 [Eumeta japonica]